MGLKKQLNVQFNESIEIIKNKQEEIRDTKVFHRNKKCEVKKY